MKQSLVTEAKVILVAVEYGGQWPVGLRPSPDADLVAVVQVDGEDPSLFARRLLRKVIALVAQEADVVSAVLAVAPNFHLRHQEARCAIARTILRAFRHGSKGELCLVEPSNARPDCLAHLLAIAEGLMDNAATDCRIRVGYETIDRASPRSNLVDALKSWSTRPI